MSESGPDRPWTGPLRFLGEARQELAKVTWPPRREVFVYSVVVMTTIITLGLLVFVLDVVFSRLSVMLLEKRRSGLQLRSVSYQALRTGCSLLAGRRAWDRRRKQILPDAWAFRASYWDAEARCLRRRSAEGVLQVGFPSGEALEAGHRHAQ